MKQNLIIIGTGETAERVYRFVRKYDLYTVKGFAANSEYIRENVFCGLPVFAIEDLDNVVNKSKDLLFVALFWNRLNADRRRVYESLKKQNFNFANLISPNTTIDGDILGENCWICDFAVIQQHAQIGSSVFIMEQAFVGHMSRVSSHCHIGASAMICGSSYIGEQCFIGINAIVFDCTNIGKRCIVGVGTAVKRNMSDNCVIKLSNDNFIIKEYSPDEVESKLLTNNNVR